MITHIKDIRNALKKKKEGEREKKRNDWKFDR